MFISHNFLSEVGLILNTFSNISTCDMKGKELRSNVCLRQHHPKKEIINQSINNTKHTESKTWSYILIDGWIRLLLPREKVLLQIKVDWCKIKNKRQPELFIAAIMKSTRNNFPGFGRHNCCKSCHQLLCSSKS